MASKDNKKGKEVDWKATREMLSSSPNTGILENEDEEPSYGSASSSINTRYTAMTDEPNINGHVSAQARYEPAETFEATRLLHDLDEVRVIKKGRIRGRIGRAAPPPPVGTTPVMKKPAMRNQEPAYEAADDREDRKKIGEARHTMEPTEEWTTGNLKVQKSPLWNELDPALQQKSMGLDRWECHECCLTHPINIEGVVLDNYDPNVCQCCNHDRCGRCWDLDENRWRVKHCDGSPLEEEELRLDDTSSTW